MTSLPSVLENLRKLVSFNTTSRNSNLDLVNWVEAQLTPLGACCTRIGNDDGSKTNLWARIGPDAPGGIILSGHTDVVPVDGQDWATDPFNLTQKGDLLYGRGTADMKSFIALCLAVAPVIASLDLERPIHFAFSYDEEVGCQGAPAMISRILDAGANPSAVWVGEPTLWQVVSGHKGTSVTDVIVTGQEAHSSLPHQGISAIGEAVDLMSVLRKIERDLAACPNPNSPFDPPHPTLTIGTIHGGTAANILARHCAFTFDLRCPPGFDVDEILEEFLEAANITDQRLKSLYQGAGVTVLRQSNVPPLTPEAGNMAELVLRKLTGDNALRVVPYATEAGQFRIAGIPAVVCGPGSIDQAHIPNEFVAVRELEKGVKIFEALVSQLQAGHGFPLSHSSNPS